MRYNSFWNNNSNWDDRYGVCCWDFKNYKNFVYFKVPTCLVEGNRNAISANNFVYGRISKENGKIETFFEADSKEGLVMPFGNFTVFDDELYTWCHEWYDETYYIMRVNTQSKKGAKYKVSNIESLVLVMKNQKGNIVCLLREHGDYYVKCMNTKEKVRLWGIDDMETSLVGYNEKYIYYEVYERGQETYYCVDIDSFDIIDISYKIRDISNGKEVYMVDCGKDSFILKNGKERELISVNWIRGEQEVIASPKLYSDMGKNEYGYWHYVYNGDFWMGLHDINDNPYRAVIRDIVFFDTDGEIFWSTLYEAADYKSRPLIVFSYVDCVCVWNQHMDSNRNFYDEATLYSKINGEWKEIRNNIFVNKH